MKERREEERRDRDDHEGHDADDARHSGSLFTDSFLAALVLSLDLRVLGDGQRLTVRDVRCCHILSCSKHFVSTPSRALCSA